MREIEPVSIRVSVPAPDEPEYRRITDQLRQDIIAGTIPPETWLRLQTVALRFGVSVQPVREALQVLQGEGLIEFFPNRGAKVRGIDRQRIIHIYEIREAMESFLSRRFAEEASLSDIEQLKVLQGRHDQALLARDVDAASDLNWQFHRTVNARSGNREALNISERYQDLAHTLFKQVGPAPDHFERITREHHAMLDAFRRRDGAAAMELSAQHIRSSLASHLRLFDEVQSGQILLKGIQSRRR